MRSLFDRRGAELEYEEDILPSFKCKDIGVNCDWGTTTATETELMKNIAAHALTEHKMINIAPDMLAKIKSAIPK